MPQPGSSLKRFDVSSRDPEYAHEVLREAYADFTVRTSGSTEDFAFAHSGVAGDGLALGRTRYSMDAELDFDAPGVSLIVAARSAGSMALNTGRDVLRPDLAEPVLMPPDAGWRADIAGVTVQTVTLDREAVDRAVRGAFGPGAVRARFTSMVPVSPGAARYWRSAVEHAREGVLAYDEVAASPLIWADTVRMLAVAALTTFPNTALAAHGRETGDIAAPAVLRRALAYIEEHAGEDVGVEDIAVAARVGVRTLQNLFRRYRDRTPLEELRRVRLARAHADLLAADPSRGDTVTTVALRWGFRHPGRFAVLYRDAYGRSPRDSLRA